MTEWRQATLGEVAQVVGGGTPSTRNPAYWGEGVIWLTPSEVTRQEGKVISDSDRQITPSGLADSSATLVPKHTVLLTSRATVGAVALAGKEMATNQGFQSLIAKDGLLPHYLMFWVQANRIEFQSRASGSTFPEISGKKIRSIPISVPSLAEQRRIVDLLASVDATIEGLQAEADTVNGLLAQVRADVPMADEVSLGAVLDGIDSGRSVVANGDAPVAGHPRILKLSAVQPGRFVASEAKYLIDSSDLPPKALVRDGDLLMTRSNTPDRVGFCAVAREVPEETYMPDLVWRLRVRAEVVSVEYLEHLLSSDEMRSRVMSTASGTSMSMRKINKRGVSAVRLPLPTLDEQRAYVQKCSTIKDALQALETERDNLRQVRSALLAGLLSQALPIPESYDALLGVAS